MMVPLLFLVFIWGFAQEESNPDDVYIGAIFSFNTTNGRVSKIAMDIAVEDVNSHPTILKGRKLYLSKHDANYSGFRSIIGGTFMFFHLQHVDAIYLMPYFDTCCI